MTRARAVLAAILLVAVALRVFHLGAESVWLDEAASIQIAHDPPADVVSDAAEDVHPPLYYLALHWWMEAAGDSARAVRWLSVIFSVLGVLAAARFSARWFGREAAVVTAAFAAVSPLAIAYAQEGRMYALLSLLAILSIDEFLRVVRGGRRAAFVGCVAATAAMLYTHAYAGFVVAGEALWLIGLVLVSPAGRGRAWRRGGLAIGLAIVAFLPWVPSFLAQIRGVERHFWIPPGATLVAAIEAQAGSRWLAWILIPLALLGLVPPHRPAPGHAAPGACTPGAISPGTAAAAVLAAVVVSVIAMPYALSRVSSPIFLPKYTIAALPAFLALAAAGVTRLPSRVLRGGVVALVVAMTVTPLLALTTTRHKDDWRGLVSAVERQAEPGDLVVFSQTFGMAPFDYYAARTDLVELPFVDDASAGLTRRSLAVLARVATAGFDRVWIVESDPDATTAAMKAALSSYRVAARVSGGGVKAALYLRQSTPPGSPIR